MPTERDSEWWHKGYESGLSDHESTIYTNLSLLDGCRIDKDEFIRRMRLIVEGQI